MAMANGASIEAVLTLNASGFDKGLTTSLEAVDKFKTTFSKSITPLANDITRLESSLKLLGSTLVTASEQVDKFSANSKNLEQFNTYALAVNRLAKALELLSSDSVTVEKSMNIINNMFKYFQDVLNGTEVKIKGVASAIRELGGNSSSVSKLSNTIKTAEEGLLELGRGIPAFNRISAESDKAKAELERMDATLKKVTEDFLLIGRGVLEFNRISAESDKAKLELERMDATLKKVTEDFLMIGRGIPAFNRIETGINSVNNSLNQTALSTQKYSNASKQATASTNAQTTATNRLKNALSSLKMIGSMVASMMVYNFAHNLVTATRETVNAKSEMEGYFKMLHFSESEVSGFNKALDETVQQFQRVNKYSLGETISSIGVEFNLTTEEMEKAMKVTSMVTSEYLRAGRNANEASLAVKDVLQGQFQRLSRETGVKGEQLKDAGWSGDNNDVLGLMEALEKVAESRNWDVFAEKANSLNDIVTIIQNRFGEWSADMVNVVQPTIVNAFNSIMSTAQALSEVLGGFWQWLNTDGWSQTAIKIGAVSTALLVGVHSLTAYRTGATLTQVANMGLKKSIAGLVLGIKAEELANKSATESMALKVLGINSEKVAELGLTGAINQAVFTKGLEKTTTEAQTWASGLRRGALVGEATAISLVRDEETGAILVKEGLTIATTGNTTSTVGFTGALGMMIAGEQLAEGQTLSLTGALGALTGAFLTSPIGWFALAVLGLASAFYVASGGLSDTWDKMKQFNETMKDPHATINPYKDRVSELNDKLEKAKEKYGENSKEVEKYSEKLKIAKDDLNAVTQATEHGVYWNEKYQKSFDNIGIKADENLRKVMKEHGYTDEQIDKTGQLVDSLTVGSDKQYHALQVLHKQQGDSKKQLDDYATSLENVGIKGDEATQKMGDMASNLQNLQTHSAIANSSDDWWEWMWNSLYAGMDQFWIDLGKLEVEIRDSIFNWDWLDDEGKANLKSITDYFDGLWDGITKGLDDWEKGAKEFLKPLDSIGDEFNKFMDDPLGYLGLGDIDILGAIMDAIFPDPVSAGDGSSDHPSFAEDLSAIVGFDIQTWIENFNTDPLGTLGIELPKIDIMGIFQNLFSTGDNGNGGLDIGSWLSGLFDISGFVADFTTNLSSILPSVSSTVSTVGSMFSGMKDTIRSHLSTVVSNVSTGFESVKTNAVSKITSMKDSVKGVIDQMTGAWTHMKDSILNSAKLIYDGVKSKFDSVKTTLSDFFTKLQNPSQWGAGHPSMSRSPRPATARSLFGRVSTAGGSSRKSGAGISPYTKPNQKVKLGDLIDIIGTNKEVTLSDFLSMFSEGGFGGWEFHEPSKKYVFDKGKQWKSGSPTIQGIGSIDSHYKVERFWNGKPSFSWDEFMTVAEAIFSRIPYKFYYDSEWKGSWLGALLSGAVNCSDGADALIALASVFGFSGSKVHTTTKNGIGHFYANINGHNLDTTHFQNSGSWSPLGGAGVSRGRGAGFGQTVHVTVDMSNSTVYGVDDLDDRIADGVDKGLQRHMNDPYTVAI